jgi:hypothetical protein
MKLKFFNTAHNGDIFNSRITIVTLSNLGFDMEYYHNQKIGVLEDIPNCKEFNINSHMVENINENVFDLWVGKNESIIWRKNDYIKPFIEEGVTFNTNKVLSMPILSKIIKNQPSVNFPYFGDVEIKDEDLLPSVFLHNLKNINCLDNLIVKTKENKRILICNGPVLSGQSVNFNFDPIVDILSTTFPEYSFILSNESSIRKENVFHFDDYSKVKPDLLLFSYFSELCDVIIGRVSGPMCYTYTKNNLLSKDKTFICISNRESEAIFYEKHLCKINWSNDYRVENIIEFIKNKI